MAAGIDSYSLMTGPYSRVEAFESPELVEHFEQVGRPSMARFEREWLAAQSEWPDETGSLSPEQWAAWLEQWEQHDNETGNGIEAMDALDGDRILGIQTRLRAKEECRCEIAITTARVCFDTRSAVRWRVPVSSERIVGSGISCTFAQRILVPFEARTMAPSILASW
jgi:hypothetical protein